MRQGSLIMDIILWRTRIHLMSLFNVIICLSKVQWLVVHLEIFSHIVIVALEIFCPWLFAQFEFCITVPTITKKNNHFQHGLLCRLCFDLWLQPATILVHIMHTMQCLVYIFVPSNLCPHLRAMARALPLVERTNSYVTRIHTFHSTFAIDYVFLPLAYNS
jgi:hypothetical protein